MSNSHQLSCTLLFSLGYEQNSDVVQSWWRLSEGLYSHICSVSSSVITSLAVGFHFSEKLIYRNALVTFTPLYMVTSGQCTVQPQSDLCPLSTSTGAALLHSGVGKGRASSDAAHFSHPDCNPVGSGITPAIHCGLHGRQTLPLYEV